MKASLMIICLSILAACGEGVVEPENYNIVGDPVVYNEDKSIRFYVTDLGDRNTRLERAILVRDLALSVILNSSYKEATIFLIPEESLKGSGVLLARAHCVYSKCEVEAGEDVNSLKHFTFPE